MTRVISGLKFVHVGAAGLIALALALGPGCARTPTGNWRFTLYTQKSAESETRRWYVHKSDVLGGGDLVSHVESVAARVARASHEPEREFSVRVLDLFSPGALSLGDGRVFITKGMLLQFDSDAELAWVMGHEIGHITAQHGRSRLSQHRLLYLLSFPLLPFAGPPERTSAGMSGLVLPVYSRAQEIEADDLAASYADAAGYAAGCAVQAAAKLARRDELNEAEYGMLSSHPASADRFERLRRRHPRPEAGCDDGFLALLDGVQTDGGSIRPPPGTLYVSGMSGAISSLGLTESPTQLPGRARMTYDSPRLDLEIERYPAGRDLEWARTRVDRGARDLVREDASELARSARPSAGRPSVSITVVRPEETGSLVSRLQWVEIGDRVYYFKGWAAHADWELAEVQFDRAVDSFRLLTSADRRAWKAVIRVRFHVVEAGETLEDIQERYAVWDLDELRSVNLLADEDELVAGTRLRVGHREQENAVAP